LRLLKDRIFGHKRFLIRGLSAAKDEIGFATMAYNPSESQTCSVQQTDGNALPRPTDCDLVTHASDIVIASIIEHFLNPVS